MKRAALDIGSSLKSDDSVLSRIVNQQNKSLTKLKQESTALQEVEVRASFWATIKSVLSVIFACVLFVVMLGFIYVFPAKAYVSDKV